MTLCLLFPCALCLLKLQVSSLADKTVIISKVTCSDAATVCATNKGDIYLLNQYICRRIISRYGNHYWASATGWQKEEDGKTFVFGKFHWAVTFVPFFCFCLQSSLNIAVFWTFAKKSVERKLNFSGISFQIFNNFVTLSHEVLSSSLFCHSDA